MNMVKSCFLSVLAGLLILAFTGVAFGQELFVIDGVRTIGEPKFVPDEIIVKFKRGVSEDVIRQLNQSYGTSVLSISKRGGFRRVRIPRNRTVEEMVSVYSRNPNVEYSEPNFIASALMLPNDPYYSYQWHLDNSTYGGINMECAWDIETGEPGVIVAVIDTGVAYENYGTYAQAPDLANTNFVAGYDFVNNDGHPNDDHGHGTHVTGTVAQSTNNYLGVAGVAFNTSIMPIKVLDAMGYGDNAGIADGIYHAADKGAHVINLSLGGTSPSITVENAVAYAYNKGVTIVCAAGNDYQEGNPPVYPAAYDAYCIAVGATRYDETRSYYSNTGNYLDIAAPGGDTGVDQNGDGYADGVLQQTFFWSPRYFGYYFKQGTSMASPHVAGVAALLIANNVIGPDNVRKALEETAEDKGAAGWDPEYGWGIVDACAALNYSGEPVHDVAVTDISAPSSCVQGDDDVEITVTVANQGDFDESFDVTLTDDSAVIETQSVSLPSAGTADLTFYWDTTGASIGNHLLKAAASAVLGEDDTGDNTRTTTVTVQEPVHDVAIVAVDAPSEANEGDLVSVAVTVENQGTCAETTTVTLTDTTDAKLIGSESVSLNAGHSTIVSFDWDTTGASLSDHTLEAKASEVSGEIDSADNSMEIMVTVQEPVHDVAIVAVDAPSEANEGELVSVDVTVENQGTYEETTAVSLADITGGGSVPIGLPQLVTLAAGGSTVVSFEWDTSGAPLGDHILEAVAEPVLGETDTADNSMTTTITINEQSVGRLMHISDISVELVKKGRNYQAIAYVTIVDEDGNVSGAVVTGNWTFNGSFLNTDSGVTDVAGIAALESRKVKAESGTFTITVTNVEKTDCIYDPDSNVETSDSISVP